MKKKNYRRFNLMFLPLVAFNILSVALFNLVVDPYGILKSLGITDANNPPLESEKSSLPAKATNKQVGGNKPQMTFNQREKYRSEHFKLNLTTMSISRINPKTILLGTSTVLRLSPSHPALAMQPAYNLGLPGAKMHDIKSYFEDTLADHPDLKQVVIGIDLFSFGNPENKITSGNENKINSVIEQAKPTIEVRKNKYNISLKELITINFSVDTFKASLKKIIVDYIEPKQINKNKLNHTYIQKTKFASDRFNFNYVGMYFDAVTKTDVKVAKSEKKTVKKYIKNNLLIDRKSKKVAQFRRVILLYFNEKTFYKNYNLSKDELNSFKAIIDTCNQRHITTKVFFSPVHAAQLEAIHTAGLWSAFEEWKRQVVAITPAWDFSDYSSITTEPVNDYMENFADSVHYQDQIGDLILDRLYNYHQEIVPSNFGLLVTPANIESHLSHIRAEHQAWLKNNSDVVKFVQDLRKQAK